MEEEELLQARSVGFIFALTRRGGVSNSAQLVLFLEPEDKVSPTACRARKSLRLAC